MITILRRRFSPIAATPSLPWYGVEWDESESSFSFTRIGDLSKHVSLPIQSKMLGCLLSDAGVVSKYLNTSDWTSETRDGSQGQVMVEIPEHYRKFEREGTTCRIKISEENLDGYVHVPKVYMSAYEAALDRTNSKLASVVNTAAQYRGGNNTSSWDGKYRSLLGMPASNISADTFRTYARNRGSASWNMLVYNIYKTIVWLYVVEYASVNVQDTYNAQLTAEGYRQGGLGVGVTDWTASNAWNRYNSMNPVIPCGHTDSLGNGSGVVAKNVVNSGGTTLHTYYVPRYRGVENLYGHLHQLTDGAGVIIGRVGYNASENRLYTCSDPSLFKWITASDVTDYNFISNLPNNTTSGVPTSVIGGNSADIIALTSAASYSDSYYGDCYSITGRGSAEAARVLLLGGNGNDGTCAGLFRHDATQTSSSTATHLGTRLCFIPST